MSATVILLLIGLWAAVLMPGLLRARRDVSPATSISRFNRSMDLLERTRQEAPSRFAAEAAAPASEEEQVMPGSRQAAASGAPVASLARRAPAGRHRAEPSGPAWPRAPKRLLEDRLPAGASRRGARSEPAARRAAPAGPYAGGARDSGPSVVARRRAVLAALAGMMLLGAALTPLARGLGMTLFVLGALACGAYLAMLWKLQQQRALRQRVRHLDRAPVGEHPDPPAPTGGVAASALRDDPFAAGPPARAVGDLQGG